MLDWDHMDNSLKSVSSVYWQAEETLKCYYQREDAFRCFDSDLPKMNLALCFFSSALLAMQYQVYVGTAKLFDHSGTAGIPKIFNQGEQHPQYREMLKPIIKKGRTEYELFEDQIQKLRLERDKFYAHMDKQFLANEGRGADFLWEDFEPMLKWALSILSNILETCGAVVPTMPIHYDLKNLLDKVQIEEDM